jgi:hypothetical protein
MVKSNSKPQSTLRKTVQKTLLFCGEGNAEVAMLTYLKAIYAPRDCGVIVTIKNAHGKGAANVIHCTINAAQIASYDSVCAVFDTDTDWNEAVKAKAKRNCIHVFPLSPCLEAVLCRALGLSTEGLTPQLKAQVKDKTGMEAHYNGFFEQVIAPVHEAFIAQADIAAMINRIKR